MNLKIRYILIGMAAGSVTGLLGAGGGLLLVPLLGTFTDLAEVEIFPASLSIMLPICLVSLLITAFTGTIDFFMASGYMAGSALGGLAAGMLGKKLQVSWLHRFLGIMIIWGGIRCLT